MTWENHEKARAFLLDLTAKGPRFVKSRHVSDATGLTRGQAAQALRYILEHPDGVRLTLWNNGAKNRHTYVAERA